MEDDPTDQCAHGDVVFTIDSVPFVTGDDVEDVTVSAAALFLLRTLTHNHTAADLVAEESQLFPHCGHSAVAITGRFPVVVFGCKSTPTSKTFIPRERSRFAPRAARRRR
jgi:hypothetical protein